EGGGYVAKGVYRPMQDCSMKSISINNFCPVCKRAIKKMIDFYSE
ncbi:MAG TPA: M64 family metallopeptidase, partial [Ignavibacteriaceae bacterium]|nr:M64 family metallopeptidase [Ignavibacteriaceae bacterium]